MNYKLELSADDVTLIGEALDLLPHGRVQRLVAKIQPQLSEQEAAERHRLMAEQTAAGEAWRDGERAKLVAEMTKSPKTKKRGH